MDGVFVGVYVHSVGYPVDCFARAAEFQSAGQFKALLHRLFPSCHLAPGWWQLERPASHTLAGRLFGILTVRRLMEATDRDPVDALGSLARSLRPSGIYVAGTRDLLHRRTGERFTPVNVTLVQPLRYAHFSGSGSY